MGAALMLAVAITLSGECGPLGPECELAVARTMANRIAHESFPNSIDGVLDAYYGRATPTDTSIGLAAMVVLMPGQLADRGALYAYSDTDRKALGWRQGETVICDVGLCVHLSREWPGD